MAELLTALSGSSEARLYVGDGATKDIHRFLPSGGYLPLAGIAEDGGGDGTTSLRVKPDMDKGRWYHMYSSKSD